MTTEQTTPTYITAAGEDPRIWSFGPPPAEDLDGEPITLPYGEETVGIVDDNQGGIIAYAHQNSADTITAALTEYHVNQEYAATHRPGLPTILVEVTENPMIIDEDAETLSLTFRFPHPAPAEEFTAIITEGISDVAERAFPGDQLLLAGAWDGDTFHAGTVALVIGT